jgi:hypothetical protein
VLKPLSLHSLILFQTSQYEVFYGASMRFSNVECDVCVELHFNWAHMRIIITFLSIHWKEEAP